MGDPLALQAKPITGQVVLVTLRVCDDDEKEEDNNFRGFPVVAEDTLMRQVSRGEFSSSSPLH